MAIHSQPLSALLGEVAATGVSLDEYMTRYADQHCEWVEGIVIRMTPAELRHNNLVYFLYWLLKAYFELRPVGRVVGQPFIMRLPAFPNRRREPDLLVILNDNPHPLGETSLDGPADVCVEVVSEASIQRDHGDKFREYEAGGVPEYWIIDPIHREGRFYRLDAGGHYARQPEDAEGRYTTPALPGFALPVSLLWQDELPGPSAIVEMARAMLA